MPFLKAFFMNPPFRKCAAPEGGATLRAELRAGDSVFKALWVAHNPPGSVKSQSGKAFCAMLQRFIAECRVQAA
jgi:hypothetical protein